MLRSMEHKKIVIVCVKRIGTHPFVGACLYLLLYATFLNHLDTLFSSSSINHDFLEDDGWVVRTEGEGVDAIG